MLLSTSNCISYGQYQLLFQCRCWPNAFLRVFLSTHRAATQSGCCKLIFTRFPFLGHLKPLNNIYWYQISIYISKSHFFLNSSSSVLRQEVIIYSKLSIFTIEIWSSIEKKWNHILFIFSLIKFRGVFKESRLNLEHNSGKPRIMKFANVIENSY